MGQMIESARSHVRRGREQWAAIMREYELGGIPAKAFCKQKGLALSTFTRWRRELKLHPVPAQAQFVPVTQPATGAPSASQPPLRVELDLGGGMVLRVQRG